AGREAHHGRRRARALRIGDDLHVVGGRDARRLDDGNTRVRGPEVDPDDLPHTPGAYNLGWACARYLGSFRRRGTSRRRVSPPAETRLRGRQVAGGPFDTTTMAARSRRSPSMYPG